MLVQNHTRGTFNSKYVGDYCVVALRGNQVEVRSSIGGPTEMKFFLQIDILNKCKIILPLEQNYTQNES